MSDRPAALDRTPVKVGQIWKDNYRYAPLGCQRYVKVISIYGTVAVIKTCAKDGRDSNNRPTKTKLSRFNGKTGGFSLVEDATRNEPSA